jgi:sialic acid synthase SpsE
MVAAFQVPVGYSDHTPGIEVPLAAVALDACVVEVHFTLDRNMSGPDHKASLEPSELKALVRGIRIVESALGDGRKEPAASEANTASVARRSLVAACAIPAGTKLTLDHIEIKRPGTGLPPAMQTYLVGLTLKEDLQAGAVFSMEMFT